jgi:hypothetical protein
MKKLLNEWRKYINEVSRGEMSLGTNGTAEHLELAVQKVLGDGQHESKDNPLSLEAIKGAAPRYLKELGLDDRGVQEALKYFRQIMKGGQYRDLDGRNYKLVSARIPIGRKLPNEGAAGLYLVMGA